jgi:hypothetical protein
MRTGRARRGRAQFASVPSKSIVAWVPSQNGLFDECPQRQIAIGSECSITLPSMSVRVTGPETTYGPFSLGVMLTPDMVMAFLADVAPESSISWTASLGSGRRLFGHAEEV